MTEQVIDGLLGRHRRLRRFALAVLPDYSEVRERLKEGELCESMVSRVSQELSIHGHSIPSALELDADVHSTKKGVYYDTGDLEGLTRPLAERLWRGGFRQFRKHDILQCYKPPDFDMLHWFIDKLRKGVSISSKHRDGPTSGLHLYAAWVGRVGQGPHNPTSLELTTELMKHEGSCRDTCSCLCAPTGCTPLSVLIKEQFWFHRTNWPFPVRKTDIDDVNPRQWLAIGRESSYIPQKQTQTTLNKHCEVSYLSSQAYLTHVASLAYIVNWRDGTMSALEQQLGLIITLQTMLGLSKTLKDD